MSILSRTWVGRHKWRLLLASIMVLLIISPISRVYDEQDNIISPLVALVFLAVILGTSENQWTVRSLSLLTVVWLMVSVATEGSGLFTDISIVAPALFMGLLLAVFILVARWLIRAVHINTEVICAAICGYLLLGILWVCLYAIAAKIIRITHPEGPSAFVSSTSPQVAFGDLLYFSYTTLTTTGFGDVVPRSPSVRMLAVLEAMTGLFYNTIVIARFVGLYGLTPRPMVNDPSVKK